MWNERIELNYRVFVRTIDDMRGKFVEIESKLKELPFNSNITKLDSKEIYWPCDPSEVTSLTERGFLVTKYNDAPHLIIRELLIVISVPENLTSIEIIKKLDETFGEKTFASCRIISERLSDKQAL